MKLAVIGSGPLALYAASHFYNLGAHVVLFQRSPLGGNARFCVENNIQADVDYPVNQSVHNFWKEDLVPMIEFIEEKGISKAGEVLRVHKRFLHAEEVVLNRTRLVDLFRVIYSVNPKDAILKQLAENPEIFKQLGESVVESLHEPVESFEDFDLVIEATGRGKSDFKMGPSGTFALNEINLKKHSHFYYGKEFFKNFSSDNLSQIVVVGDDIGAYIAIAKLEEWLLSVDANILFWIKNKKVDSNSISIKNVLEKTKKDYEIKKRIYEENLFKWRDLEDYMKAKVPMPIEPIEKIQIYEGYTVTSIDKLLDRNGVFVTIESPDFREHSNVKGDLKTIPCDVVVVQNGVKSNESLSENLSIEEPGYYILQSDSIKEGVLEILEIEEKVMNFFSKSDQ